MTSLPALSQTDPRPSLYFNPRIERLTAELCVALIATDGADLAHWGLDTGKLFLNCGWNRLARSGSTAAGGVKAAAHLARDGYEAWCHDRSMAFMGERIRNAYATGQSVWTSTRQSLEGLGRQLGDNPAQVAPRMLATVLLSVAVSGGADANGGAPDLDLMLGIEAHRSIFSHSIIMGALLETGIFSLIRLIQIVHAKLPRHHDPFWDGALEQAEAILDAARAGVSLGMAYHLLGDGLAQPAPYKDLPFPMPMEAHQAIFTANGVAELANAASPISSSRVATSATPHVSLLPESSAPKVLGLAPKAPIIAITASDAPQLWPHSREFNLRDEAKAFHKRVVAKHDTAAKLVYGRGRYTVKYGLSSEQPVRAYRSKFQFKTDETSFIRAKYFLWVPIADIAVLVDRNESDVHRLLCEQGLCETTTRWKDRLGQLEWASAYAIYEQIARGFLTREQADILRAAGLLDPLEPENDSHTLLKVASLSVQERTRLAVCAVQHKYYDIASRLFMEVGDAQRAYFLALQCNHVVLGLRALEHIVDPEPILLKVRELTRHYLRQEVVEGLPEFLQQWDTSVAAHRNGQVLAEDEVKALRREARWQLNQLKVVLGTPDTAWRERVRVLEKRFAQLTPGDISISGHDAMDQMVPDDLETFRNLLERALPFDTEKASRIEQARWNAISRQGFFVNERVQADTATMAKK